MAVILTIKVIPSSGRQSWDMEKSGRLRCYLKNPPENNKANEELISFLAKTLHVSKSDIAIITGLTARIKTVKISTSLERSHLLSLLGIQGEQNALF